MPRSFEQIEDEEAPGSSSPTESKRVYQNGNGLRSKHSETEQRRRSKINERSQILRDLIPESDQKRDKASFLLEVIEYIQFLQEKLQMYEGSCRRWSPDPTELMPWKIDSGPIEGLINQSHLERHLPGREDLNTELPREEHTQSNSDFSRSVLYKSPDIPPMAANQCLPLNMPFQPPIIEDMPGQPHQRSFPDAEPRSHFWREDDCSVHLWAANGKGLKSAFEESSISSAYSQGLLNSLRAALQSSGVDVSQANISVQLDMRKRTDGRSAESTILNMKERENPSGSIPASLGHITENYDRHPLKRFRVY